MECIPRAYASRRTRGTASLVRQSFLRQVAFYTARTFRNPGIEDGGSNV
jgi:hypothetical protein